MKSEKVETIRKKHRREWLLISVDKMDDSTTTPLSGRLIAHSPFRHEIYQKLARFKRPGRIFVEYSEHSLPKGYVAAL